MMPLNDDSTPTSTAGGGSTNWLSCAGKSINFIVLLVLSAVSALLFIQLQALQYQVASEQRQIDDLKSSIANSTTEITAKVEKQHDLTIINIAGTFTLLSCVVTMFHMTSHLRNMNQPVVQRKIMAILWMSPIYGITSFLSLVLPPSAEPYLGILKDFYESYVIYQFLSFLVAVIGRGDREAVISSLVKHADHLKTPYRCLYCLFHPHPAESNEAMANAVLIECQFLAMQFVFFKPVTAIVNFVLEIVGVNGDFSTNKWAYFYSPKFVVMLVVNVSVFLAFSGLLKFYHAVSEELAWCQPFAKFMTIKGVVFMTFWQSLLIGIIFHASYDNSSGDNNDDSIDSDTGSSSTVSASYIQHVLICMEMLLFSAVHFCVFPAEEWEDGYKAEYYKHTAGFGFKDFASDVNMIIDSGKRSMQARRDKKEADGAAALSTSATMEESTNGLSKTANYDSMDETLPESRDIV